MVIRAGRFGPFLGCSGFPKCRNMKRLSKEEQAEARAKLPPRPKAQMTEVKCEQCGKPMVIRTSRRGAFLGCSGFPKCRTTQALPDELKAKEA
jgi:DNA topoisomerase-1